MDFVTKKNTLKLKHVLDYRIILANNEIDEVIINMSKYIGEFDAKVKRVYTITMGINF